MSSPLGAPLPDRLAGGRLGRIVGAYALAALGAAVLRTVALIAEEIAVAGFGTVIELNGWLALLIVPLASAVVIFLAAAPFTTAFVVFAESRGLRSAGPHLLAGAVIGLLTQVAVSFLDGSRGATPPAILLLAAAVGLVAGWLYWMVAIRAAPPPPPEALPRALGPTD